MATVTKQWPTGGGSLTLTYTGSGNGSITATSPFNESRSSRTMSVAVKTTGITRNVTVTQAASPLNWKSSDGYYRVSADNKYYNVYETE